MDILEIVGGNVLVQYTSLNDIGRVYCLAVDYLSKQWTQCD
jgi:hypothetical protein